MAMCPSRAPVPLLALCAALCAQCANPRAAPAPRTHSFLQAGGTTCIRSFTPGGPPEGTVTWTTPWSTRDATMLPDGNLLLVVSRGQDGFPGGGLLEITREQETVWKYVGQQEEVNSGQKTAAGTYVLTEAGPQPRLLEVDAAGRVLVQFPLACQRENAHMQTRMARKLADGTYLVPHLLDFAVKQYDPSGAVLRVVDTRLADAAGQPLESWPFTAIALDDGGVLVGLTHANTVAEFDARGRVTWQVSNAELGGIIQDACGVQRLPNGNTVVTSYAAGPGEVNLWEVTPDKRLVWSWRGPGHVHAFQILDTDGLPLSGPPLK